MKNKKLIITLSAIGAVLLILIISIIGSYNGLVEKEEKVKTSLSNIEVQLQHRADLIPNFVASVDKYVKYEQETLTAITEARSSVTKAIQSGDLEQQAQAEAQLESAIDGFMLYAVNENYPNLEAQQLFVGLQDGLASTENKIQTARRDYNDAVESYNKSVRRFPSSIVAGMFGFEKAEPFKAAPSAYEVPQVK